MTVVSCTAMAAAIIFTWAVWCVFCRRVNDGIIGKVFYSFVALAAFSLFFDPSAKASVALNWGMALLALRQLCLNYVWPNLRKYIAPCSDCPQRRAGDL